MEVNRAQGFADSSLARPIGSPEEDSGPPRMLLLREKDGKDGSLDASTAAKEKVDEPLRTLVAADDFWLAAR